MKVVITGVSGFIGSWLMRELMVNHDVVGLVRKTSDLSKLSDLPQSLIIKLEPTSWPSFISDLKPDVVILNDWWGVGNEHRNNDKQFENTHRIVGLVKNLAKSGIRTVIGVGSQAELGPIQSAITEFADDNPTTKYGEAKVETRLQVEKILHQTEVRFIWMRIFSTYGPLDQGSWLIPNMVETLLCNQKMQLTKGEQEWSYLHAFDLASAFGKAISISDIHGVVNIGNPQIITIREVAQVIAKILGKQDLIEFGSLNYRKDQVMKLQPVCETLTKAGWKPKIPFEEGIKQTLDWLQRKELSPIRTFDGKTLNFNLPKRL